MSFSGKLKLNMVQDLFQNFKTLVQVCLCLATAKCQMIYLPVTVLNMDSYSDTNYATGKRVVNTR